MLTVPVWASSRPETAIVTCGRRAWRRTGLPTRWSPVEPVEPVKAFEGAAIDPVVTEPAAGATTTSGFQTGRDR